MAELYIPTLHAFAMGNLFTGSQGSFRFRAEPQVVKQEHNKKEVDMEKSFIVVEFWHGDLCYEKSKMEGKEMFPMSEEGRLQMKSWLESSI